MAPSGGAVYARPQALAHSSAPVMKLPTSALRQEGKGTAVWVLDKSTMTVRSQSVQVATADGNEAVIAGGISPGMMVVAAGVHVLSPGQKVTIYQSREAAAAAANAGAKESAQPVTAVAATNKEIASGAAK